jgi:long-chain acyl-CoA synthetase
MTFLEHIFGQLQQSAAEPVLQEIHGEEIHAVTGSELLAMIQQARRFLLARGLQKGDRCALLAPNSIRWAALDLALMAEGIVVVPLYARQAPAELVAMMQDSTPSRIFCLDAAIAAEIKKLWPQSPQISLLEGVYAEIGRASCRERV